PPAPRRARETRTAQPAARCLRPYGGGRAAPAAAEAHEGILMDVKMDEALKALVDSGKGKGYLTYSQVNDYLPDDAVNPEKLDQLLLILEEQGIELIDESEADEREAGPAGTVVWDGGVRVELELSVLAVADTR